MSYKIAIASGKGGTGKTTVSVNLHTLLNRQLHTHLVDCDVEEPNDLIFFDTAQPIKKEVAVQLIPDIDKAKCTFCSTCADYCEFNAISIIPSVKFAKVDQNLCHSCGACLYACQEEAITEHPKTIGEITHYRSDDDTLVSEGRLSVGSPMQTMLIKELKQAITTTDGIIIYDAPPGTSCSVVETINDADYVVLITEPTLFGLHDLKLMVELVNNLKRPFGLIINKAGLGDDKIYDYIAQNDIELLGEIPFSKAYAGLYAKGEITHKIPPNILKKYESIINQLMTKVNRNI